MARFTVNATRVAPYQGFLFKIKIDGQYVAGLSKCGPLKRTTEVTSWYEGGDAGTPILMPGKTKYESVTLEAGVTRDTAFEEWANKVNNFQGPAAMSLATFRKDIAIEVFNLGGQKVLAYNLFRCWVSEYQALPELDASGNAVMITMIKLEYEGFERDTSVVELKET